MSFNNNLSDDYHINSDYQQASNILPKVRPSTGSSGSNASRRVQSQTAVPATPRMLRNSSGNFQQQQLLFSQQNPTQHQQQEQQQSYQYPDKQGFSEQIASPQRSNSDAFRSNNHTPTPTAQPFQSPNKATPGRANTGTSTSPTRSNLPPLDTSSFIPQRIPSQKRTPNSLLPPANVNQVNQEKSQQQTEPTYARSPVHNSKKSQPAQFHRRSIGDWDFMKTIGAGSMGKVKLAKHRKTSEICAIKIVPRAARIYARSHANDPPPADSAEALKRQKEYEKEVGRDKRTIREASLGKVLYHPFICRLFEVITMSNHYYMLFEYVSGGQMLDYIVSHGSLKERHGRKFARGIASALDYLHRNNVVHRDLKIENIMISKTGDIKIIDFGLSNMYSNDTLLKTYCGSLYFAAPELLSAHPYIGPEVDVWSFGVVLYVLVCGKVPFDDQSVSVLHEKIKQGKVTYPEFLSLEVVSLLSRMLVVNPNKRATLAEVMAHPWMTKGFESSPISFVPHRIPISLPLDALVLKEMVSLEFGQSEEQIAEDLTLIITSELYVEASKAWHKSPDKLKADPTNGFHPLVSIYYLVDEMLKRKRARSSLLDIPPPVTDRERTHASLLESHSQVQSNKTESFKKATPEIQQVPSLGPLKTPNLPPVISFPEAAHTSPTYGSPPLLPVDQQQHQHQQQQQEQQQLLGSSGNDDHAVLPQQNSEDQRGFNAILRKFSQRRANSQRRAPSDSTNNHYQQQQQVSYDSSNIEKSSIPQYKGFDKDNQQLVRRVGSMKLARKSPFDPDTPTRQDTLTSSHSASKSHNRAVSAYAGGAGGSGSQDQTSNKFSGETSTPDNNNKVVQRRYHPSARAKSVGHRRDHAIFTNEVSQVPALPSDLNDDAFFDDVTLDEYSTNSGADKVTLVNSNVSSKRNHYDLSELNEAQILDEAARAPQGSMPSIEYPRSLFLKGFFSVQTTSTKPLPVIRANVISVLSKLGVQFTEVRGGFVCVHTPSIEQPSVIITPAVGIAPTTDDADDNSSNKASTLPTEDERTSLKTSNSLKSNSENGSNDTTKPTFDRKSTNDDTSFGESSHDQQLTPTSASKSHRRKFSIGGSILGYRRKQSGATPSIPPTPIATTDYNSHNNHFLASPSTNFSGHNDFDSSASLDSINGAGHGGSDMLISSRIEQNRNKTIVADDGTIRNDSTSSPSNQTNNQQPSISTYQSRTPLKFEIHIVKVPLVGLFGVQFKKVSGNTWMYKALAGQILNELNL